MHIESIWICEHAVCEFTCTATFRYVTEKRRVEADGMVMFKVIRIYGVVFKGIMCVPVSQGIHV